MASPSPSAVVTRDAIPYAHWSMRVGRGEDRAGEIVAQIADLEQGIHNLVLTPIGSVPTEPEKGCDVEPFIDRNEGVAIPGLTEAIFEGLTRWHPRIAVDSVLVTLFDRTGDRSHWRCPVFWRPRESVLSEIRETVVPLSRERLRNAFGAGALIS